MQSEEKRKNRDRRPPSNMKKFIITGIQMRNKGSQAMFLSLYYGLKSIYKDCEITGFAFKYDSPEQYTFRLLPWDDYTRNLFYYRLTKVPLLTHFVSLWKKNGKWRGTIPLIEKELRDADGIFDASGYTLGSGWSKKGGQLLLQTIKIAKRYNKKIILMPQSVGPFDWGEEDDAEFIKEVKKVLAYPLRIYAREAEGYECLTSLDLKNVELSTDLVIREKFFPTASNIFASYDSEEIDYPIRNSVACILNENVFRIGNPETVLKLYVNILDKLVDNGETVYIVNTSAADMDSVTNVLSATKNSDKVRVISGDYSSPELIEIIGRFKYVIASRYHSVVFAYRSAVPAIILGWANKYDYLAALFEQENYVFDIRKPGVNRIIEQIDKMGANYEKESQCIKRCLEKIQASSVVQKAISALQE